MQKINLEKLQRPPKIPVVLTGILAVDFVIAVCCFIVGVQQPFWPVGALLCWSAGFIGHWSIYRFVGLLKQAKAANNAYRAMRRACETHNKAVDRISQSEEKPRP